MKHQRKKCDKRCGDCMRCRKRMNKAPIPFEELGQVQKLCLTLPKLDMNVSTASTLPTSDEGHTVADSGSCSVELTSGE